MKRHRDLFHQIISKDNLHLADRTARKGKANQYGVKAHDKNRLTNIEQLHLNLSEKKFHTSNYSHFKILDPKERLISCLPYYPDRIVHHAIMRILEPIFTSTFTSDSYSCIKGKGIHGAQKAIRHALNDEQGTTYCLKLDIVKFYPSIDHDVLKSILRRKIKDQDLLWLLDDIIDSSPGIPIGNYLSQYFANFYLTGFDHWIKEVLRVNYYFRYADDLVILSEEKTHLHSLLFQIKQYLGEHLKLQVKDNYQVFPVDARGIDFVGYRFFHSHTLVRKRIKQRFARMLKTNRNKQSIASYKGWLMHCDSKNLTKKLLV